MTGQWTVNHVTSGTEDEEVNDRRDARRAAAGLVRARVRRGRGERPALPPRAARGTRAGAPDVLADPPHLERAEAGHQACPLRDPAPGAEAHTEAQAPPHAAPR